MAFRVPLLYLYINLAFVAGEQYWWKFTHADCEYDDVSPQPSCGKAHKGDVEALKTCCLQTSGCGGFNTNGVIKNTDCLSHKKYEKKDCDLYVIESSPQPPTSFPFIWPLPKKYSNGTSSASVSKTFKFSSGKATSTLTNAFTRYTKLIFVHDIKKSAMTGTELPGLDVSCDSYDESHPQLETDESYTLTIPSDGTNAKLHAATIYGALHGLETFSQLVVFNFDSESYDIYGLPWQIEDAPRFAHRGLMMDTSRHFQPLASIYAMIDSLPYAKINVLHWHVSDSQSFPLESKTYPKLWDGAYSEEEKYIQADVADVVEYARERGVRVMVEFDMPGHAASWCKGYPEVCPSPSCNQPLNVATNATFDLITSLLKEMTGGAKSQPDKPMGLFPDNFIHLGGDEVNTGCWTKTPSIAYWLIDNNMTADQGYAYFVKRAAHIAISQGRRPVQWVEVFDHFGTQLPKEVIVHVWKAKSTLPSVVKAGYNALINNSPGSDSWYLDHINIKWDAVYGNEPCSAITDEKQCALVLGGQGEMWGEKVDASDFQNTVWPKLGAIAEKLWSPRAMTQTPALAHDRIKWFRCLLNHRGVAAAPVDNDNARDAPPRPGSCYEQ